MISAPIFNVFKADKSCKTTNSATKHDRMLFNLFLCGSRLFIFYCINYFRRHFLEINLRFEVVFVMLV